MIKKLSIKEFREKGYLQEVNRRFFHPLGLALEVVIEEDGTEKLGGIWDYREDPEGIIYGEEIVSNPRFRERAEYIEDQLRKKKATRLEKLGFFIQPVEVRSEEESDFETDCNCGC